MHDERAMPGKLSADELCSASIWVACYADTIYSRGIIEMFLQLTFPLQTITLNIRSIRTIAVTGMTFDHSGAWNGEVPWWKWVVLLSCFRPKTEKMQHWKRIWFLRYDTRSIIYFILVQKKETSMFLKNNEEKNKKIDSNDPDCFKSNVFFVIFVCIFTFSHLLFIFGLFCISDTTRCSLNLVPFHNLFALTELDYSIVACWKSDRSVVLVRRAQSLTWISK